MRPNHEFTVVHRDGGCTVTVSVAKFTGGRVHRPVLHINVWTPPANAEPHFSIQAPHDEVLYGEEEIDALIEGLQLAKTLTRARIRKS